MITLDVALDDVPACAHPQAHDAANHIIWSSDAQHSPSRPSLSIGDLVFIRNGDGKHHVHGQVTGLDGNGFRVAPAYFHARTEHVPDRITFGDLGDVSFDWTTVGPVQLIDLPFPRSDAKVIDADEAIDAYCRIMAIFAWPCKWW